MDRTSFTNEIRGEKNLRLTFLALLTISLLGVFLLLSNSIWLVLLNLLLLCVLAVPLTMDKRIDIFNPSIILAISFYTYCFFGPANLILTEKVYFYSVDIMAYLPHFYILSIVSAAGSVIGSRLVLKSSTTSELEYSESTLLIGGLLLSLLSLGSFIGYYYLSGNFTDRSHLLPALQVSNGVITVGYLLQGLDLCVPGLCMLSASRHSWVRKLGIFVSVPLSILALTTGFRSNLVKTTLPLFMMSYLRRGRRPRAKACILGACTALIAFAIVGQVRAGSSSFTDVLSAKEFLSRDTLLSDLNVVQAMTLVTAKVPSQRDYLYGASLAYIPTHVLPRSWFPDKGFPPEVELVWDLTDKNAGFAIPMFGLFYLNYGYIGAFVGMMLVAWALGVIYRCFLKNRTGARWQIYLLCTYIITYLSFPRHSLVHILTQVGYCIGPLLIVDMVQRCVRLVTRQPRRTTGAVEGSWQKVQVSR